MTDDPVSTNIITEQGIMHFQEFWVGRRGRPEVKSVFFTGLEKAIPSQGFLDLLEREETVLIGPSNPVTSIGPILALPGVWKGCGIRRSWPSAPWWEANR